ncbi:MAG: hypothetical protein JRE38_13510 [Deltaproteobacteria bacterium]|nr:hypothetical protein [Deltaproteobacteria bacterium]
MRQCLLRSVAVIAISIAIRPVQADVWAEISLDDVYGIYQVDQASNTWNTGAIRRSETRVVWANAAGVYWNLEADLDNGRLLIGPDCPYYDEGQENNFDIVLEMDAFGDPIPVVSGFMFNGVFHRLASTGSPLDFILQDSVPGLSDHYTASVTAFLLAKSEYESGLYGEAMSRLDSLWAQYPVGDSVWWSIFGETPFGLNLGTPPAYYGLRQLTDMTEWRLANPGHPGAPRTIKLSVLMVGHSSGIEPRNLEQLETGGGVPVTHDLDVRVPLDDYAVVHESLGLFKEYIHTITKWILEIDAQIIALPNLDVAVEAWTSNGVTYAGMSNYTQPFASVSESDIESTDWWWIVYPAHIPEQYDDFQYTGFIAGGMGRGPNGGPCFIADDRWLVRVPGHLGLGTYEPRERMTYLPQWLQHEIFHHFYQVWHEFGLEEEPHQWFDQGTWPADFEGQFEPDYFHESVFKRLHSAELPFHVGLRYATADAPWDEIELDDILGYYERLPVNNAWQAGNIWLDGAQLRWQNTAGVSWNLAPDLAGGALQIGPDCPYYDENVNNDFRLVLEREDQLGDLTAVVKGFSFLGELYSKQACEGQIPSIVFLDKRSFVWDGVAFPYPVFVQGEGRAEIAARAPSIVGTPTQTTSAGLHNVAGSNPAPNELEWWLVRTPGNDALCNITWSSGGAGELAGRDAALP